MDDTASEIRRIAMASAAVHGSTTAKIVLAKLLGSRPDLRGRAQEMAKMVEEVVCEVNSMDPARLAGSRPARKTASQQNPLPNLPGAIQGEVVTRFPPNPTATRI